MDAVNADPAATRSRGGLEKEVRVGVSQVNREQEVDERDGRDEDSDAWAGLPV